MFTGNLCIADDYTMEHTFILIKPDGVQLGLVGKIISKFSKKGFTLKGLKMTTLDRRFAEKHHQDLSGHPLFRRLVNYIISGPVVAMIWEGTDVVSTGLKIIRNTIPRASDLDKAVGSTAIQGSDSSESAYKEIALWFPDGPVKGPDAAIPVSRDIGRMEFTGIDTMEQTLILIKPDGVQSGLVGNIICRFDRKGFTLKGLRMITVDRPFAEKHYQDLSAKPFFSDLVKYICSGSVVAMIWEGKNVVSAGRKIIEKTIPCDEMDTDIGSYLVHGSDSLESAIKESALWFPEGPVKLHSDAAKPKARDIGRISVTGFGSGIPHEDVESALRVHFASCGEITDVYIGKATDDAYIYFVGEGAVDKALELSGSEVNGGWKVFAEAYPFYDDNPVVVSVEGYATSLGAADIDSAVRVIFSSCGTVTKVCVRESYTVVYIKWFEAEEKVLELCGSIIVGGRKVLVKMVTRPPRYTVHVRRRCPPRPAGNNDFARI